jgi:hypothetical protein
MQVNIQHFQQQQQKLIYLTKMLKTTQSFYMAQVHMMTYTYFCAQLKCSTFQRVSNKKLQTKVVEKFIKHTHCCASHDLPENCTASVITG